MNVHQIAAVALEWWRASGERTETRLRDLCYTIATTNGQSGDLPFSIAKRNM